MTAGHFGAFETFEKLCLRYFWPGFTTDVKHRNLRCDKCQKLSGRPQKHIHSLVDWKISYPFHYIRLDFLGPLPNSNGCRYILLIGDHFNKWDEAIPLPDQSAATTSDDLSSVGFFVLVARTAFTHIVAPTSSPNFSPIFTKNLKSTKKRTAAFHRQSNSVIERMN